MAVGCKPARRRLADDIGKVFLLIRLAPGRPLEGEKPIELVLLIDGVGHKPDDVVVAGDETGEDGIAVALIGGAQAGSGLAVIAATTHRAHGGAVARHNIIVIHTRRSSEF